VETKGRLRAGGCYGEDRERYIVLSRPVVEANVQNFFMMWMKCHVTHRAAR